MDPAGTPRIKPFPAIRYRAEIEPELVSRARWLALRELTGWRGPAPTGWSPLDSSSEVGRLLRVLAGTVRDGIAGEIGTDLAQNVNDGRSIRFAPCGSSIPRSWQRS
jgi:hypothetical protein